jgi:hypothetical protein
MGKFKYAEQWGIHSASEQEPIKAITPKNDLAKETQRLDTLVVRCKVGVAWVELLPMKRRLKFRVYNDCPQNKSEVTN